MRGDLPHYPAGISDSLFHLAGQKVCVTEDILNEKACPNIKRFPEVCPEIIRIECRPAKFQGNRFPAPYDALVAPGGKYLLIAPWRDTHLAEPVQLLEVGDEPWTGSQQPNFSSLNLAANLLR